MMPENWIHYIFLLQNDDELSESQKQLILDGWMELKQIFDDDWLKEKDNYHPIISHLKNTALWSRLWLAYFGITLSELGKELTDKIKQKLLSESQFYQTYDEIDVASKFKRNGYSITFVKEKKKRKTPDIIAKCDGRELCIEVTMKSASEDWLMKRKTFMELSEFSFIDHKVNYFCIIHKSPLSTPKLRELKEKIKEKFEKARNETGYEEFVEPNVIECYICTNENIDRVPPEKRIIKGPRAFINGSDEIRRIKGTIKEKVSQLCDGKPGILVIYENNFDIVVPFISQNRINDLVNNLDEAVNEYSQLSTLVLIWSFINTAEEEKGIEEANYAFSKRMEENGAIAKYILIIKNQYAMNSLTSEEIDLIKNI